MQTQIEAAKSSATATETELGSLNTTLKNIEETRSVDQLTVRPLAV
jgi:hypothetical protein